MSRNLVASGLSLVTFWGGLCLKGRWGWLVIACASVLGSLWGLSDAIDGLDDALAVGSGKASWAVWLDWPALWAASIATALAFFALLRRRSGELLTADTPAAQQGVLRLLAPVIAIAVIAGALSQAGYWASHYLLHRGVVEVSQHNNFKRHVVFGHYKSQRMPFKGTSYAKYDVSESLQPPEGEATINGRVLRDGEPVAGLELRAVLNDLYQTDVLTTDAEGRFAIRVQRGQWALNFIELLRWPGKPSGERFVAISGQEPPPTMPYYWGTREEQPLGVFARRGNDGPQVTIRLQRQPQRDWPPATDERKGVAATRDGDALQWRPVAGAEAYIVGISVVNLDEGKMWQPRAWYAVGEDTSLPLRQVETVKESEYSGSEPPQTYSYRVFAFDGEGQLLTFTPPGKPEKRRFQLSSDRFISNRDTAVDGLPDGVKHDWPREDERRAYRTKILAFHELVEAGRRDAASAVLANLDDESVYRLAGKRQALQGALDAMQGRCEAARAHYRRALETNPRLCAGDCVNQGCSTHQEQ